MKPFSSSPIVFLANKHENTRGQNIDMHGCVCMSWSDLNAWKFTRHVLSILRESSTGRSCSWRNAFRLQGIEFRLGTHYRLLVTTFGSWHSRPVRMITRSLKRLRKMFHLNRKRYVWFSVVIFDVSSRYNLWLHWIRWMMSSVSVPLLLFKFSSEKYSTQNNLCPCFFMFGSA